MVAVIIHDEEVPMVRDPLLGGRDASGSVYKYIGCELVARQEDTLAGGL